MGRAPCCDKASVKRGPWSPEEDAKLKDYMEIHGTGGNWITLPRKAGLKRCGKSCRLRWLNYLRPDIKHGEFSDDEDRIICTLFANIGSRWSIIAAQLPGRTDNDIKNYWNTKLKKKFTMHISANNGQRMSSSSEQHLLFNHSSPAIPPARSVLRSPNSDHFYKLTPFSSTSSSTSVTNPPFTGHEAASCTTSDVSSSMDLDRIHPHQQQMLINDLQGFSPPYNRESEIFSGDQKIANYRVGIPMDRYGIEEISQLISGSSPYSNVATLDNNNSSYNSMIRELISSSSYHSNAATSGNNDCSYNSFLFGGVENRSIMTSDSPNLDTGADEGFIFIFGRVESCRHDLENLNVDCGL